MPTTYDPAKTPVLEQSTLDQLLELDDGQTGLIQEMVEIYRQDMPDRLRALEITLSESNLQEASEVAHALKGAASTMGAPRARAVAARMEEGGRRGDLTVDAMRQLFPELLQAYEESLQALDQFLQGSQS